MTEAKSGEMVKDVKRGTYRKRGTNPCCRLKPERSERSGRKRAEREAEEGERRKLIKRESKVGAKE